MTALIVALKLVFFVGGVVVFVVALLVDERESEL